MTRIHATAIVTYSDGSARHVNRTLSVDDTAALRTALLEPSFGQTPTGVEILSVAEID